jgi:hypothetical protein
MRPEPDAPAHRAGARGRASSLPVPLPLPLAPAPGSDSESPAAGVIAGLAGTFAIPSDLLHARPASLADAHAAHRQAAAHWNGALPRHLRHAWGWLHVALKAVLHAADWVTASPARFFVAAMVAVAVWFWL